MITHLLCLEVRRRRDLLIARRRGRQVAGLLGFEAREQACIAAAVFEIGRDVLGSGRGTLKFQVDEAVLKVIPSRGRIRLEKPLPGKSLLSREDLVWAVRELARCTGFNLMEEVRFQNQELLHALRDLQACQEELARLRREFGRPAAA
jgi:hypothetical protein